MTRSMNGRQRRALILAPLLAALMAGCAGAPKNATFDLSVSSAAVTQGPSLKSQQLLIADPTALKALDSENIVVRLSGSEVQYLGNSQWSDRLPRMVQSKLVEAFEDTGKLGYRTVPLFIMDAGNAGSAAQKAAVTLDSFVNSPNALLFGALHTTQLPQFGFSLVRSGTSTGSVTVCAMVRFAVQVAALRLSF